MKAAIRFYESRGYDWTDVVAFILTKHLGLPWLTRTGVGTGRGRPRKVPNG